MRSQNVLLLIVLFAVSAFSFDLSSFVELGEIKDDPVGKSLIETISMSLEKSQGGKIENIQALLEDLIVKLINDQKSSDVAWGKERTRLDNKIRDLELQITKLRAEIAALRREKASFEARRTRSIANIAQYQAQLVANTNTLNTLAIKRKQDQSNYKASQRDHSAMIGAIDQVIANLRKLRGSISGIGKPSHVGAIASEKRDAAWKAGIKKSFVEIVGNDEEAAAFAELATEADQNALSKLIALLKRINRNVKKSLADDEAYEKESRATYRRLRVTLKQDNAVLTTTLARQRANLERYIKRINELTVTIKIRVDLLKSRRQELKNTRQERLTKEARYNSDKKKRNQEKSIINKLQRIVKDRLARMSQFLKSKTN
jgi:chromosome segregation ATPase